MKMKKFILAFMITELIIIFIVTFNLIYSISLSLILGISIYFYLKISEKLLNYLEKKENNKKRD